MNTDNENQSESLDEKLTRLICEHEGISPDELTIDYIHKQREKRFYPNTRYDLDSIYGGYSTIGLKVYTLNELNEIKNQVHKKMDLLHESLKNTTQ